VFRIPEQIFQATHGDPVVGQEQLTVLSQQLQRVIQEHIEGLGEILLLVRKVTCQRAQVGREKEEDGEAEQNKQEEGKDGTEIIGINGKSRKRKKKGWDR
jgi:hypothetical protein